MPYMTEKSFEEDAMAVIKDLKSLKELIEKNNKVANKISYVVY